MSPDPVGEGETAPAVDDEGTTAGDDAPTTTASPRRMTARVPTTTRSVRVMRPAPPVDSGSGGRSKRERDERKQGEQDQEGDRELPEPTFDAAPASIDRGVATERARQARAPGLEQDGEDQRDADDDLAGGQEGVHETAASSSVRRPMVAQGSDVATLVESAIDAL